MTTVERETPTLWLMDGRTGWRVAFQDRVAVGPEGMSLAPLAGGLLSFADPNRSLGGLLLPPFLALDADGLTYLLVPEEQTIKRFNPTSGRFQRPPTIGGRGREARQFQEPRTIAVHQDNLYVVDPGAHQVKLFTVKGLATRAVWGPYTAPGAPRRSPYPLTPYLSPNDVRPEHARRVLDFLNAALAAREIADTVEFPGEPDVGMRVSQRLLDRRAELGRFTTLQQVADVVQVGPERFTEIVVALTRDPVPWKPVDIAFLGDKAYVLDDDTPAVWEVVIANGNARPVLQLADDLPSKPARIAAGNLGELYVLDEQRLALKEFRRDKWRRWRLLRNPDGSAKGYTAASELAGRIAPPPLRADQRGRFCMPPELMAECCRKAPEPPPADDPLAPCRRGGKLFNRSGEATDPPRDEPLGTPYYASQGEIILGPLDSSIYRCQWHKLVLGLSTLPGGVSLAVLTYADDRERNINDVRALPASLWARSARLTGHPQPSPSVPEDISTDMLVQSRQGQYLWVRLAFQSDGYATPRVRSVEAHYPRTSYLDHLPAVYQSDPESTWFLQRFLSIVQSEWDSIGKGLDDAPRLLDPEAVPDGQTLDWLASWLALSFGHEVPPEHRRRLLQAAIRTHSRRGTPAALRDWLGAHLANFSGIAPEEQHGYPFILESFRLRKWLFLNQETTGRLSWGGGLWGPGVVGRMQLEKFSRIGDVQLLDTGHADTDVVHEYSNRFSVFVPAALVPMRREAETLRQALNREKPAHTVASLHLVEPRFRIGVQATIGMDTLLGPYPTLRLATWDDPPDTELRPPRSVLGFDSVLAAAPNDQRAPSVLMGRQAIGPGLRLD